MTYVLWPNRETNHYRVLPWFVIAMVWNWGVWRERARWFEVMS